jgi:hypothetical protein
MEAAMTADAITYSFRGTSKKAPLMGAACFVVSIYVACVAILRPHHLSAGRATAAAVVAAAFFAGALGLQVDQLYTIDRKAGLVSRLTTFFGVSLWKKHWSLNEFSSVNTYRLKGGTPQAAIDLVYVGLRKNGGSTLAIKYFQAGRGRPCPAAEEFASDLQRVAGVPAAA